jgi:hypothetical protein
MPASFSIPNLSMKKQLTDEKANSPFSTGSVSYEHSTITSGNVF